MKLEDIRARLNAIKNLDSDDKIITYQRAVAELIRIIESLLEEKGECEWTEEDPWGVTPNTWQTTCGNLFTYTEGGPFENDAKFCCYCGKKLAVVRFQAEEEPDA